MKIKEVVDALEMFAPLPLQDGFDNAGLQIGLTECSPGSQLQNCRKDRFTERTDTGTQRKFTAEAGNICSCQTGRTSPSGTIQCRMRMYR